MPNDFSGFIIPEQPIRESAGINRIADSVERNKEREYRKEKDAENDQWKKLNLIQDLTDLSKHQTGSDVANTIGNQQAGAILKKYTELSPKLSATELMAQVHGDMSATISGMDAIKNELEISDEQLKLIKAARPGVDIGEVAKTVRADILNRRMKGNTFVNPLEVKQSELDFSDPEVLSEFVTGNKSIKDLIFNNKGAEDETVLMGKQGDYTTFKGKLNLWQRPTYDRTKYDKEGFYNGKEIPSFEVKAHALPSDALPSSNGSPFMVMDDDVYNNVIPKGSQEELEIIALAKNKFGKEAYKNFNPTERAYAKSNVLYDQIKAYDQSQLHPTSNVRPAITNVRVNNGRPPTKAEIIAGTPLNLNEYKQEGDGYDVTRLAPGIKVTGLPDGKTLSATKILFNPDTKKMTYTDVMGETVTEDFETFRQNIATINTGVDLSFIDRLKVTGRPGKKEEAKPAVTPKDKDKQTNLRNKYGY